jgi:hypothetical protein
MIQPEAVEKIKELYGKGYLPVRIAEELGINTRCIYYIMRFYGLINDDLAAKIKSVVNDYLGGMTLEQVAKKYGYTRNGVATVTKCVGAKKFSRLKLADLNPELTKIIKELYEAGKDYDEITAATGLPRHRIYRILKQLGVLRKQEYKNDILAKKLIEMLDKYGVVTTFDFEKETGHSINKKVLNKVMKLATKPIGYGKITSTATTEYSLLSPRWTNKFVVYYEEFARLAVAKILCEANEKAYASSLYDRIHGPLRNHFPDTHIRIKALKFDVCYWTKDL